LNKNVQPAKSQADRTGDKTNPAFDGKNVLPHIDKKQAGKKKKEKS